MDRHAVASGEDESRHDKNRMRDIDIGERGSEIEEDSKIRARSSNNVVIPNHACVS